LTYIVGMLVHYRNYVGYKKFEKLGWVFMDPAKPYEPHLWIDCSWGHTR